MGQDLPPIPDGYRLAEPTTDLPPIPKGYKLVGSAAPAIAPAGDLPPIPEGYHLVDHPATPTPTAPAPGDAPGPVETFVRHAANAVSGNLVNPLAAGISSLASGQSYGDALKGINESDQAGKVANGRAAAAGSVVGTVLQAATPTSRRTMR